MDRAIFEVFRNGKTTGRRFNSRIAAEGYARKLGGEVRVVGSDASSSAE